MSKIYVHLIDDSRQELRGMFARDKVAEAVAFFLQHPPERAIEQGRIYASCGHALTEAEGFGKETILLEHDRTGNRTASYGSACSACFEKYTQNHALATKEEADAWIEKGILPERMKP